jgi:hypothetical protein
MTKTTQIDKDYKELRTAKMNVTNNLQIAGVQVTATAAELNALDGVTATPAELNLNDNQPASVTFVVGTEGSNIINIAGTVKDAAGAAMAVPCALPCYLADDSAGLDPSTVAPSVGMAIGTDGALIEWTANLSGMLITEADGTFDIDITDVTTPTFYLVVILPNGLLAISGAITFA